MTFLLFDPGWCVRKSSLTSRINGMITQTHITVPLQDYPRRHLTYWYLAGDRKATALKAEVWIETVTEGGRRFMAAWRKEEVDAARYRQKKREATRLGKFRTRNKRRIL